MQLDWHPSQICSNIPAGACCRRIQRRYPPGPYGVPPHQLRHYDYVYADYSGLDALSLAVIWEVSWNPDADPAWASGCGGRVQHVGRAAVPLEANVNINVDDPWHGPGTMNYMAPMTSHLRGAMWIRLDQSIPSMDAVEGVRGFLSGGVLAGRGMDEKRDKGWRQTGNGTQDIQHGKDNERGGVVDEPPGRWVWPDVLDVGGVEYHRNGEDEMVFTNKEGKVFDWAQLDY